MAKKILQESERESKLDSSQVEASAPRSFEHAMAELEQLVGQMEAGALPLEASLTAYRRGAELVRFCNAKLEHVDQQVKVLEGDVLKPLVPGSGMAEGGE
ncbi:MAG: exodeoxyribonuclease VII small subunit [Pseudomonadota bacterium]